MFNFQGSLMAFTLLPNYILSRMHDPLLTLILSYSIFFFPTVQIQQKADQQYDNHKRHGVLLFN